MREIGVYRAVCIAKMNRAAQGKREDRRTAFALSVGTADML